jgi:hypothetical protein
MVLAIAAESETTVFDVSTIVAFLGASVQAKKRKIENVTNAKFFIFNDLWLFFISKGEKYGAFRSIGAVRHQAISMTSQRHD